MNTLTAVFWDYPELTEERRLRAFLTESGNAGKRWALLRFLERARVNDTFAYFELPEIAEAVETLREGSASREKWERLLEVYGTAGRR